MSWTLAVETSAATGSLALFKERALAESVVWPNERSHSEKITTEAQRLLNNHGLSWPDLTQYCVSTGPGSFTGIRVALTFVKSMAYSFSRPVLTTDSLFLMALPALQEYESVFCMQSAFRNLTYCALYQRKSTENRSTYDQIFQPTAIEIPDFRNQFDRRVKSDICVVGRGYSQFLQDLHPETLKKMKRSPGLSDEPLAQNFLYLLGSQTDLAKNQEWRDVSPLYVRASEAEEKLKNK